MNKNLSKKYNKLVSRIREKNGLIVGFSGGVDSTLLLKLGSDIHLDRCIGVTVQSESFTKDEVEFAKAVGTNIGARVMVIKHSDLKNENWKKNGPDRCYHCKKNLVEILQNIAKDEKIETIALGTVLDDLNDYRPGLQALIEHGIWQPYVEVGLRKKDVRTIAQWLNLNVALKPSNACLASRIAYNEEITKEKLKMVEKSEKYISNLGFSRVRVRFHNYIARIEVAPSEIPRLLDEKMRKRINIYLKKLGFIYVTIDIAGYRSGSMNESLKNAFNVKP